MRRALAGLIVLTPVAAWAGPPPSPIPTPEQAGFNTLVAEVTTAQRALAIANANIAALSATIGRERAYWSAWTAGDIAKASPGAHKVEQPKITGVKHGAP